MKVRIMFSAEEVEEILIDHITSELNLQGPMIDKIEAITSCHSYEFRIREDI